MRLPYKRLYVVAIVFFSALSGCGGGGGGGAPSPPVLTGDIDGYVYVPAAPVSGATRTATVSGGYEPLQGASVTVNGTDLSDTTDSDGYYFIAGVPAGAAAVTYSKPGYKSAQFTVNVTAIGKKTVTERDSPQGIMVSQIISVTYPGSGDLISDVDFRAESFYIGITHTAPIAEDSVSVSFSMDGGLFRNITSYFSQTSATEIQTGNLYQFTRTLFDLPSNTQRRTMTVNISARDMSGNFTSTTSDFIVYPVSPPGQ